MCQNFNETAQVDACSQYTAPLLELATVKVSEGSDYNDSFLKKKKKNLNFYVRLVEGTW